MASRSSKPDTWMPFYIGDYLADTQHLTTIQHGAYILLLITAWKRGGLLPNDDGQLAAIARVSPTEWKKMASVIRPFFKVDGHVLVQKRLTFEYLEAVKMHNTQVANGKKGGRPPNSTKNVPHGTEAKDNPRVISGLTQDEPKAKPKPNPEQSPSQSQIQEEKSKAPRGASALAGFDEFWLRYPRKVGKGAAEKSWIKLKADYALRQSILSAIEVQSKSAGWLKDSGQFIPNPATWLNQRRWEDQVEAGVGAAPKSGWWNSVPGIEAKGMEFNISPHEERFEDVWPRFKIEVLREARRRGIQCEDLAA